MLTGLFNTYWWMPQALPVSQGLPRIDVGGIYKLSTSSVSLTGTSVDYGIRPCEYSRLPNESIVLLTVHADSPEGGDDLPVTVSTGSSTAGVTDSQGNPVTGSNVAGNTQRLAYINKCSGTVRFLEFTNS